MKAPAMEIINGRQVFYLGVRVETKSIMTHGEMMWALQESIDRIEDGKFTLEELS